MSLETKIISEGRYTPDISFTGRDDELGDIANAVNAMTGKMRSYIGELQEYGKKTEELNARVHRKVITLTNLMRMGDLISSGVEFEAVANFACEKITEDIPGSFCAVFIKEETGRYFLESFFDRTGKDVDMADVKPKLISLENLFVREEYLLSDSRQPVKPWQETLKNELRGVNAILYPLKVNANVVGVMMLGNISRGAKFDEEEIDILRAFEKELVLGYQKANVSRDIRNLDVIDSITGLYTLSYLEDRFQDEINRALYYQRPCSLIVVNVDGFEEYSNRHGESRSKQVLVQIGNLLNDVMAPAGKAARLHYDEFAMLVPEKNKRESLEIAEDIRGRVEKNECFAR